MTFNPRQFGPIFGPLMAASKLNPLGPGERHASQPRELNSLSLDEAFAPHTIRDREMAMACLAGLWLLQNELDESHRISQDLATPAGSYWHALMHRREPDYDNAKYWFRRLGNHPLFEPLQAAARELALLAPPDRTVDFLKEQKSWDPFRFVDLCAATAVGRSSSELLCRQIQRQEWELLFEDCFRQAILEG